MSTTPEKVFRAFSPIYLKCKWCDYKVKPWRRTKTGRSKTGWSNLSSHVVEKHYFKVKELLKGLKSDLQQDIDDAEREGNSIENIENELEHIKDILDET